ncbi:hypothetical protein DDW11_02695 [Sulfolobus sp. SCGC AB-777_G06]|nr:hypothetical protein DDW11_02695 [Sulfolobus sp. SCGC AB-777_G06]
MKGWNLTYIYNKIVTKRLETKFRITKSQKRINRERTWCYVGIRLKKDENGNSTVGYDGNNDTPDNLIELYKQYSGKARSRKDLQDELGLRAYELLDFCEKRNLCHWIDEEHVEFN